MIAVDTNVLVRYLVQESQEQGRRAARLFESRPVFIAKTVLLETEWVLRGTYRFRREVIRAAFRALVGLPGARVEDGRAVALALEWFEGGLDFADALHLASTPSADGFASFDRQLRRRAGALGCSPPVLEP